MSLLSLVKSFGKQKFFNESVILPEKRGIVGCVKYQKQWMLSYQLSGEKNIFYKYYKIYRIKLYFLKK